MAFLPSSLLLLIYASSQLPQASLAFPYPRREANSFQLSSQVANFIPTCAQPCFISFLDVNFNSSRLGVSPDLDTLCSHNSSSGYTIGEGAVECIIGEDQAGGCSKTGVGGDDGGATVAQKAFAMCDGQKGALPNTHATLVATLFTSGSAVLVAPIQTRSSSITATSKSSISTSTSKPPATSLQSTITAPTTTIPSTVPLTTATGSPTPFSSSFTSPTATTPTTPTTALSASATTSIASSTATSKNPSTSKIVGISVGTVSGVAFAIGLAVYLYCLRKRRNKDRDSDIFSFTPESGNSLAARRFTEYSRRQGQMEKGRGSPGIGPGGTRDGVAAKISPTFNPRNISPPPQNSPTIRLVEDRDDGPSMRASRIGLAVSAEQSPTTLMPPNNFNDRRHSSKLLPEKPTLALQIPQETYSRPGQVFNFPSPPRSQRSSSSIMNRGRPKIDFGPPLPVFSQSSSKSNQDFDSNENRQRANTLSTDFQPYLEDTPYYPENANTPYQQNMALRKYLASDQNLHVRPLELRRSTQQSLPSQFGGVYDSTRDRAVAYGYTNPTRPMNAYQGGNVTIPPQNSNRGPKKYNPYPRATQQAGRDSTGSVTSFESFESGDDIEVTSPGGTVTIASRKSNGGMDRRRSKIKELSPVKESPSPGTPVSYPKIPGRLGTTVRMIPPPPKPDFTKVMGSGSLPRKPVPTLASVQTGKGLTSNPFVGNGTGVGVGNSNFQGAGEKPWRQAEIVAAAMRRSARGSIYTASVYTSDQSPIDTMAPSAISTLPSAISTLPSQRRFSFQNKSYLQPSQDNSDRISTASTNSSLLAKRRGEKLAAGLTLRGPNAINKPMNSSSQSQNYGAGQMGNNANPRWRVLRDVDIKEAQSPGWKPQVGRQVQNRYRMSRDVFLDDGGVGGGKENFYGGGQEKVMGRNGNGNGGADMPATPVTPGWKPRLTPTRRGNDLFLSVSK